MFLQKKESARQKTEASRVGAAAGHRTSSRTSRDLVGVGDALTLGSGLFDVGKRMVAAHPELALKKIERESIYIDNDLTHKIELVNLLIELYIETQDSVIINNVSEFEAITNFLDRVHEFLYVHHHKLGIEDYRQFKHELKYLTRKSKITVDDYFIYYVSHVRKLQYALDGYFKAKSADPAQLATKVWEVVVGGIADLADLDNKLAKTKI